MDKFKKKKLIISLLILSMYLSYRHRYQKEYEILPENNEAYAKYEDGNIYIGDEEFLSSIESVEGDVLIEDQRDGIDPNFVIYNSCKIHDKDDKNTILEVLEEYEEDNPSNWNRSIESMRLEWLMHNLGYRFNYKKNHTTDIDLDNDDEEKFNKKILNWLLKI